MFFDRSDIFLVLAQLDIEGNIVTKMKKNPTSGLGRDAITSLSMGNFTKSEPGTKRPDLSTDRSFFAGGKQLDWNSDTL